MRTTLDIDEGLLKSVVKATGQKTKSRAVHLALEDYLRQIRLKKLLALQGKLDLDIGDWYEFRHLER